MIVYAAFVGGTAINIAIDWSHWKVPERKWMDYWSDHIGPNIANSLLSLLAFVAWRAHILAAVLDLMGVHTDSALMKIDVTEPIAFFAGGILSFVIVRITKKIWPPPEGGAAKGGDQ